MGDGLVMATSGRWRWRGEELQIWWPRCVVVIHGMEMEVTMVAGLENMKVAMGFPPKLEPSGGVEM